MKISAIDLIKFTPIGTKREPPPPRMTVDGVVLKKGDVIWRSAHGFINRSKVTSDTLRYWTSNDGCVYSTEVGAIGAAIAWNEKKLADAQRETKRAIKAIARLRAREIATHKEPKQ